MASLRKSLSEDSVDRYSHTWAFLFLLLLSLITLLIPLSPRLNLRSFANSGQMHINRGNRGHPTFTSACWVPQEFTLSMTNYAHSLCASAYNSIVQGRNSSTASLIIMNDDPIPVERWRPDGEPGERMVFASRKSRSAGEGREKLALRAKDLFSFKTPLYLFILALFLRLPHAIWSLLSTCFGCINVDQTLVAAQTAQSLDSVEQERIYKEIDLILGGLRKKKTGLLYLLMKLLMIVVVCLGISAAANDFLRETEEIQKKLNIEKSNEDTGMAYLSRQSERHTNMSVERLQEFPEALFCTFSIRQLQNEQSWVVQCLFSPEDISHADGSEPGVKAHQPRGDNDTSSPMSEDQILLMYKAIFTSVWAVFILLAILNISSFLLWCLTLLLPCCQSRTGLNSEATVDLAFLTAMARQNTSCLIAMELVKGSKGRGSGEKW